MRCIAINTEHIFGFFKFSYHIRMFYTKALSESVKQHYKA
jgi:hypothetical protein